MAVDVRAIAIRGIDAQIAELQEARAELLNGALFGGGSANVASKQRVKPGPKPGRGGKREMSAEVRERMSQSRKEWWANRKKAAVAEAPAPVMAPEAPLAATEAPNDNVGNVAPPARPTGPGRRRKG